MIKDYSSSKIPVLFQIMESRGIKGTQLSAAIGVTSGNISDWRSGKSKPSKGTQIAIADFLGVSVEYLRGETDISTKPAADSGDELNEYLEELKTRPEMRMLFSVTKGATKEDVEKAVRIIEALRSGD